MGAESNSTLAGQFNGALRHNQEGVVVIPEQEPYLEIENIDVKLDFRSRHIGGRLVERLLAVAEQNGIRSFLVATNSKDMDKVLNF